VTGVITKIAPFGAFARIEDGIEGLIHLSELTPGMDPRQTLHEGVPLQLRILRIDAERRRLGLSLRQAEEVDAKEVPGEVTEGETPPGATTGPSDEKPIPSLEETSARQEPGAPHAETTGGPPRRHEGKNDKRERANENPLLSNLPGGDIGETTAMAEAFRAAARQRSKEENETTEE